MHPNWTTRGRPQAWRQVGRVRTYVPQASAMLPPTWATAIGAMYEQRGHRVEIGTEPNARGEVKLTVYGLPQAALGAHLNDPLGQPGEQATRHPNPDLRKRRVRLSTADQRLDAAVGEEEARRWRPEGETTRRPSKQRARRRSPAAHQQWQAGMDEAAALQQHDPGSDPQVIAAWIAEQEAMIAAVRARRERDDA